MLPIIKEVKQKLRTARGFTMVELMVVLLILGILAALAGAGLTAYVRLARFEHNESGARTVFQTAQIALTRKDTSGDMDTFLTELRNIGTLGDHFSADGLSEQFGSEAAEKAKAFNSQIYALYYDKANPDSESSKMVRDLLDPYVYDESLFNASIVVEVDSLTGQVYSAFYDTASDKLRFASDDGADGAMLIDDRSYTHRRGDSLVGYYSAEDTVNVVALSQTRLKVKNPQLINNETLTLNWSGNSKNGDLDTIYDVLVYNSGDTTNPLFKLEVVWADVVGTNKNARIKVYSVYDKESETWKDTGEYYTFPLSYSKGRFILTLDAMCDANLLRAAENDDATLPSTKTTLFSITRFISDARDIHVGITARPNVGFEDAYTQSKQQWSNDENTLFEGSKEKDGKTYYTLKYFRHLYNLRWVSSGEYTFTGKNTTLDWTDGSVTVYCAAEDKNKEPIAKVPSRTGEVVAWPTIPTVGENVTLDGSASGTGRAVISNLQLRGSSVAAAPRTTAEAAAKPYLARDHYVGLVGENNGTLKNITLRDPDVQINAEVKTSGEQNDTAMAMDANGTQYLQALADTDPDYRQEIWSVGALAGADTGSLTNCTVDRSSRRGAEAKVAAALTFSSKTTSVNRVGGDENVSTIYDEPHGIGGLVGFAMPETGAKLTGLTLDQNVTVAGIFQDDDAAKNAGTDAATSTDTTEKTRYNAIANENDSQTLWRAVGVGGVAGVLDATNLTGTQNAENLKNITNKSTVVGNAFVGGIAGNLYSTAEDGGDANTLTGLANQGTVLAGANYQGGTQGQSRVLGQFFGGIAGYARNLVLDSCHSATRSGLSETTLTNLVQAGYTADGELTDASPLKGDFVGGLVGFGRDIQMTNCETESGYVLGRSFVGGFVGGFVGSELYTKGGTNNSYVFGNRYVGGIVSVNGLNSTIENMTNKGLVAGLGADAAYVGGIAGVNDATWGKQDSAAPTEDETAKLVDSANSMSTVEVTDRNKIALLQQLSQTKEGTPHYADFVGGVAGYNGTNGQITWRAASDKGATLGAVLYGGSFVGGVAGYNDATATITNGHSNIPSVTGTIVATGDCVGGVIGLNGAASLPAVQVSANRIEGVHFVGGVIGANLPADSFSFVSGGTASTSTIGTGRLVADGVAGGIIGYNRVVNVDTIKTALNQKGTIAANLQTLLPGFDGGNALTEPQLNTNGSAITLTGLSNQFNIYANAYVGGIIGYNAADTTLTLENASNGNQGQAQSYGGLALSAKADAANGGAYRLDSGVSLGELDPDHNGYFAGGIIGYTTAKTKLQNCTNYGGVQHPVAAGGLTGVNDGTITGGSMVNSMGNQQEGYRYLGGIAGINNGKIENSAPAAASSIRGGLDIGGVAGYNGKNGKITLDSANGSVYGITATGGVAGYNLGTITAKSVTVKVSGTTQTGGVAGLNAASGTIGQDPYASGSNPMTIEAATTVSSSDNGGGVAGRNEGLIQYATNKSGAIQVINEYAGGIAGNNKGKIAFGQHSATGSRVLYTGGGFAGGITGCNEADGVLQNDQVNGSIFAANGEAGGITAHNYGTIVTAYVYDADIHGTSDAIGGIAACNEPNAQITDSRLRRINRATALYGPATRVGGLVGYNAGTVQDSKVDANSLSLSNLTASDSTVTAGGALGENTGTGEKLNVFTNLTDSMAKYLNLGGVAGSSSGTLKTCTYTGTIGGGAGLTTVGSTVGGIVGSNDVVYNTDGTAAATGKVKDCHVGYIQLSVQGVSNVGASQDAATKMNSAAHIGGIVGRNRGEIKGSTVGSADKLGSIITARHGFVGGVAGSNSGTITTSGGLGTQDLVKQINAWLDVPYKDVTTTDENGSTVTTKVADTDTQNANLNQMVRVLTNAAKGTDETEWQKKFADMQGKDEISDSSAAGKNQLKVTLQGGKKDDFANGYLGGITGFNDVSGQITDSASGQWFVYANNINQSWGAVGGIIGQNESDVDSTKGLVNFAAVRRYVRGVDKTDDDDNNSRTEYEYTWNGWQEKTYHDHYDSNNFDNYVGGVIGTQQNRTGDRWTLQNCVNIGTVFNSRSNNAGGVLAYWLGYGGTLQNCYNFGNITTNANNSGQASGTVGGIAGYFSAPIAGTAANLYRCSNYGSVLMKTTGANDVGGVFGKVEMDSNHTDDAMTINIIECVNGDNVKLQANSMAVGIFGYLGPWGKIPNVEVNITRCRNYSVDFTAGANNLRVGIVGNRGVGLGSNKATTVKDCFSLVDTNWADPIAYARKFYTQDGDGSIGEGYYENLTGSGNYYMTVNEESNSSYTDPSSFATYGNISGLQGGLTTTSSGSGWSNSDWYREQDKDSDGSKKVHAHRLYAGVYASPDNGYSYFAMLPKVEESNWTYGSAIRLNTVTKDNAYIAVENGKDFTGLSATRYILAKNTFDTSVTASGYIGRIMLFFNDADNTKSTSKGDINDEVLQRYYSNVLDSSVPNAPTNLQVVRSDDTGSGNDSVYGRYNVTWDAPASGSPALYYHITVYETDADGNALKQAPLLEANAYDTRFTFESKAEWQGRYFRVSVAGVNSKDTGAAADSQTMQFVRALPTPEIEIRMMPSPGLPDRARQFSQMVVLANADEYEKLVRNNDLSGWTVSVNVPGTEKGAFTFSSGNTAPQRLDDGLGNSKRITAQATSTDNRWMRSGQYDETTFIPMCYSGGNHTAGMAPGSLATKDVQITGSTIDDLTVTTKLNFKPDDSTSGIQPTYRVMLMARYLGDDTVTLNGTQVSLYGQYITLAARQTVVPNSDTTFTFTNLPDDALTNYDNWAVVAAPVNSGLGDAVTRWTATDDEALAALQTSQNSNNRPAAWYGGLEIVRESTGYSFANFTPLYFANSNESDYSAWVTTANDQIVFDQSKLTVAKAPTLTNVPADGTLYENYDKALLESANQLAYTFTWTQPGEGGTTGGNTKYKLTLYGVTETKDADGNVISTAEETITLPDDANDKVQYKDGTYRYTLNIDTDLTGGSNSWRFDKVRLRVTRDTTGTTQGIGAADTATYTVLRRLQQVGEPSQVFPVDTSNAEQTRYQISWPAVSDTRVDHYELWARQQDADGNLGEAFQLTPADTDAIYGTQTIVDLEAYQGKTLVFYVVACPADDDTSVLRSPNGEPSAPQTIIGRTTAPNIEGVSFTWTGKELGDALPLMNAFCNNLTIQMNVASADAASYFFTGYLFDSEADYIDACTKANTWMTTSNKANLDALNAALDKGTRMIPESSKTVGSETQVGGSDGKTVSYTVTPNANAFTMQPADANRYLLPALRAMVANSETAATSSSWKFYVPDNYADAAGALHLPKIQLDKPEKDGIASLTSVQSKVTGQLYGTNDEPWEPASAEITIHQYAVQWPAVNEYTDTDGTTRNFAETYRFHVEPGEDMPQDDPNKGGYDIRFTVAPADVVTENDDGTQTITIHRGEILKVEKLPADLADEEANWLDITDDARHVVNAGTDDEVTWYDLSIVEVDEPVLDADGNDTGKTQKVKRSQPVTLTGHHAIDNDNPSYRIETVPSLRQAEMTDGSSGYLVTLPDLTQRAEGDNDELTALKKYTDKVTIWAVGNGEKTADSEKLEVALRDSTQSLSEDAARSVVTLAEADNTQPAQNESQAGETTTTPPANNSGAGDAPATTETAAPAA